MVKIIDFKKMQNDEGNSFCMLVLQGGVEMVKSKSSGRYYATARTTSVSSTFDEYTCENLIGEQITGTIKKVDCEEYDYTVKETGEVIKLSHRYEYVPEEETSQLNGIRRQLPRNGMRTMQRIV